MRPSLNMQPSPRFALFSSTRIVTLGAAEDGKAMPKDDGLDSEAIVCVCQTCAAVLLYDEGLGLNSRSYPAGTGSTSITSTPSPGKIVK